MSGSHDDLLRGEGTGCARFEPAEVLRDLPPVGQRVGVVFPGIPGAGEERDASFSKNSIRRGDVEASTSVRPFKASAKLFSVAGVAISLSFSQVRMGVMH